MSNPIAALLQPMKDRLTAASAGPWEWVSSNLEVCSPGYGDVMEVEVECMSYCYGGSPRVNISTGNKALLENAPTDQAKLIAAIEAVEDWCKNLDVVESTNPGVLNVRADGIANVLRKVITQALGGECDGSSKCVSPSHIEGCFATNPDFSEVGTEALGGDTA